MLQKQRQHAEKHAEQEKAEKRRVEEATEMQEDSEDGTEKNYALAPIVVSNPNIGAGLGATGMYFFDLGERLEGLPRSSIQAFGAYTNTDSYFAGALSNLHLKQDRIRGRIGLFNAKINNEYRNPLGGDVNFSTILGTTSITPVPGRSSRSRDSTNRSPGATKRRMPWEMPLQIISSAWRTDIS